jgi:hypothetical protein
MPSAYVDNDALWSIVMALEHYDSFFRAYPEKLAEKTAQCIERARATFAVAAREEAARAQRLLSESVAQTSVEIVHAGFSEGRARWTCRKS